MFIQKKSLISTKFWIVGLPIGNLNEFNLRQKEFFQIAEVIICENPLKIKNIIKNFGISLKNRKINWIRLNRFNENSKFLFNKIKTYIDDNLHVGLLSNAGYPLISDPGYKLVRFLRTQHISFEVINGVSSIIPALIYSTFPTNSFYFMGFLSNKNGKRKAQLRQLKIISTTLILFESIHRIHSCLKSIMEIFGKDTLVCITRDLTKIYEEIIIGTVEEIYNNGEWTCKGELVVIIDNNFKNVVKE